MQVISYYTKWNGIPGTLKKNFSDFCNSARKLNSFCVLIRLTNTYLCNSQNKICQLVLKKTVIVYLYMYFKKVFFMNWHPQTKRCKKTDSCLSCQTKKVFGIVAVWPQNRYSREYLKATQGAI